MQKTLGVEIDRVSVGLLAPLKMGVEEVQESSQRNGKGAVGIMVFPHITCAEVERVSHSDRTASTFSSSRFLLFFFFARIC